MGLTDLSILVLLATGLVFSIIELGLSAWAVDVTPDGNEANDRFGFLVFCSVWTIFVTAFLIAFPIYGTASRGDVERWYSPLTIALNAVTMIFWLAGFAADADLYNGYNPRGTAGALLAFAVMLWLIFLALLILNILTAIGVLRSDRAGHTRMTRGKVAATV